MLPYPLHRLLAFFAGEWQESAMRGVGSFVVILLASFCRCYDDLLGLLCQRDGFFAPKADQELRKRSRMINLLSGDTDVRLLLRRRARPK